MHVALAVIPHNGAGEIAIAAALALDLDAQTAVDLQTQQDLVVQGRVAAAVAAGGARVPALDALGLELLQAGREVGGGAAEALGLHLEVGRGLGGAELLRVEPRDLGRVRRRRVRRRQLLVLRLQGVQLSRGFLQGVLGVAHAQVPRLGKSGQGIMDSRDGRLVGADVEVVDGVVDELFACVVSRYHRGPGSASEI